ncbi:MAG TPA: hypothetical protein VF035_08475 [Longimicrobiales bacterium]
MSGIRTCALGVAFLLASAHALQAQQAGTFRWSGTGESFVASFRESDGSVEAGYAGAAYRAQLQINSTSPYLPPHGTSAFGPVVDIYCVDFLHNANTSSSGFAANFTNLGTNPLTVTRSADLNRYLRSAFLLSQLDAQDFSAAGKQNRVDIHAAIWNIMAGQPTRGAVGITSTFDSGSYARMAGWIELSGQAASLASVNARQWSVITSQCVVQVGHQGDGSATADSCGQEFMVRNAVLDQPPMVTPEPATIIMLATGLLAIAGAGIVGRGFAV